MIQIFGGEIKRLMEVIDRILADGREYLAGPYSIGDIMHYPWLKVLKDLGAREILDFERVSDWLSRIEARSAVAKGMAVPE
jgi:GST-like protein